MLKENVIAGPCTDASLNGALNEIQMNGNTHNRDYTKTAASRTKFFDQDTIGFYSCAESSLLRLEDRRRAFELQEMNDKIQRQVKQINKMCDTAEDPLASIAEKERLQFLMARNTGEILKIYVENQERLERINQLIEENERLAAVSIKYREGYSNPTGDINSRSQCAAEFFLAKTRIEKNKHELDLLNQE